MEIRYRDIATRKIIPKELAGDSYKIEYLHDNTIKRIEEIWNNKIEYITCYRDSDESEQQILETFSSIASVKSIDIRIREPYYSYWVDYETSYWRNKNNNVFELSDYKPRLLYDSENDLIAEETINDIENENSIVKYYSFRDEDGIRYADFTCYFEPDGSFDRMEYYPDSIEPDEQDMEMYGMREALLFMSKLEFADDIKHWYVSNAFLPPVGK